MEAPPLASLSLTHVHYNPDDPLSHLCAYLALAPQGLTIIYVALIWSTREVEILLMFAGQMGCEALNWIMKRIIQEERPTGTYAICPFAAIVARAKRLIISPLPMGFPEMHGKGYGMPSSHAQYVAFFSTFLTLFLLLRHQPHALDHPHASHTHIPTPLWQRLALSLLSILCAAAVAQSRIYLNYHKPRQVYVGIAAGVICAVGWFVVTSLARSHGWVEWGLELPIARWLRLRDLVLTEDPIDAGWERWELRKRQRRSGGGGFGDGSKKSL